MNMIIVAALVQLTSSITLPASQKDLAAVRSTIPTVCTKMPAPDTVAGTAGTATPCTPREDAARPTQVMPSTAITQLDGSFSGNWPAAFSAVPTTAFAQAKSVAAPYTCQVGSWTATTYYGRCWEQTQTIKFPGTLTELLSLTITTAKVAPANITISVVGRL